MPRRVRWHRVGLYVLLLLALLALIGASYQTLAFHADTSRIPRPGRLVSPEFPSPKQAI